jgi:phosphoglucomutase
VTTRSGWLAARPSRTESIYRIFAESFVDDEHLDRIAQEAQAMVDGPLGVAPLTP